MPRNNPAPTSDDEFNPDEFEKTRAPKRSSAKAPPLNDTKTRPMPSHVDKPSRDIKTRPMPSKVDRSHSVASSSKADRSQPSTAARPEKSVISPFKDRLNLSSSSSSQARTRPMPLADRPSRDSTPKPQRETPRISHIPESRELKSKHENQERRNQNQTEYYSNSEGKQVSHTHKDDSRSKGQGTRPTPKADRTWEQDKTQFMPKTDSSRDNFRDSSKVPSSTRSAQKINKDQSSDSDHDCDYTRPINKPKREQSRDSLRDSSYTRTLQTGDKDQSKDKSYDSTRVSYPSRPMPLADRPQSSRPPTRIPDKLKIFFAMSRAPKTAISRHTTHEDQGFAARQTEIEDLPPQERELQNQWAQRQLEQFADICPMAFRFRRIEGGYLCDGGSHKVTDELLAEGKGGMMLMPQAVAWIGSSFGGGGITGTNYIGCFGPYYPEEEFGKLGVYQYYGPMPQPNHAQFYETGLQFAILCRTDPHLAQVGVRIDVINLQKRLESDQMAAGF